MLVRFDCRYVHTYVQHLHICMYVPWTNTKELKAVIMYVRMYACKSCTTFQQDTYMENRSDMWFLRAYPSKGENSPKFEKC